MRLNTKNRGRVLGSVCGAAVLGLTVMGMVVPGTGKAFAETATGSTTSTGTANPTFVVLPSSTSAETTTTNGSDGQFSFVVEDTHVADGTATGSFDFQFNVGDFIEIDTAEEETERQNKVTMEVTPNFSGGATGVGTGIGDTTFKVASNNPNGFKVMLGPGERDSDDNEITALKNGDTAEIAASTKTSPTSVGELTANTWGYTVSTSNTLNDPATIKLMGQATAITNNTYQAPTNESLLFSGLTAAPAEVYSRNKPASEVKLKLSCGTKVDTSIPAGSYSTKVNLYAVAPPSANPTLPW